VNKYIVCRTVFVGSNEGKLMQLDLRSGEKKGKVLQAHEKWVISV
jgi:outer membrane protein assembly factor BamB